MLCTSGCDVRGWQLLPLWSVVAGQSLQLTLHFAVLGSSLLAAEWNVRAHALREACAAFALVCRPDRIQLRCLDGPRTELTQRRSQQPRAQGLLPSVLLPGGTAQAMYPTLWLRGK